MTRRGVLAALLVAAVAPPGRAADFAEGSAAYDGGDYARALEIWRALAREGDAAAQVAVADLYLAGNGVAADPRAAARWFRAAAEQGDPVGQLNLGDLYSRGLGVKRDLVAAHVWLSLAAAQGRRWPRARLAELESRMTAAQLAAARAALALKRAP